jgi:cytochrome c
MRNIRCLFIGIAVSAFASTATLIPAAAPAQNANGATSFNQRCKACHSVAPGGAVGVGPNLRGVVGRKAGSAKYAYSAAMKKSALVWNKANLDKYLAAPAKTVPGTKMVIAVTDVKQRAAIIDYLAAQH